VIAVICLSMCIWRLGLALAVVRLLTCAPPTLATLRLRDARGVDGSGQNVLIVDIRGPTRSTGDGVRVMGMIMDLQRCGHYVAVYSDAENQTDLKNSWSPEVAEQYLANVTFLEWDGAVRPEVFLHWFDRIIIGGKLNLLFDAGDGELGHAVPEVLDILHKNPIDRSKVEVFWDDVPFERCTIRPEADTICPRVPGVVRFLVQLASKFYVLTVDDKRRMMRDMRNHYIELGDLDVKIWPMRIANMQQALPEAQGTARSSQRDLVTMMGDDHAVNRLMVRGLFESGAMNTICKSIRSSGSPIIIRFMGHLSFTAQEMVEAHQRASTCVQFSDGFVSDEHLQRAVYPRTRAVLNPFFRDVNSGISVKNYESIMRGVPFVTSAFGMHGLSDEIKACSFPVPQNPKNYSEFADFFVSNIVNETNYQEFANLFARRSSRCIQRQMDQYPVEMNC